MNKENSSAARRPADAALPQIKKMPLDRIRSEPATQVRALIHPDVVAQFARAMKDPANQFPPVVVFRDGEDYILADGFHRLAAARHNGCKDIPAEVMLGTQADALKYALSANRRNCLPRTNKDKRRSVALALAQWPELSIREVARICAVSDPFVANWRRRGHSVELEPGGRGNNGLRMSPGRLEHQDFGDHEAEAKRIRYLSETWPATCERCHQEFRYDKREREPECCPTCATVAHECKLCGRPFEAQPGKEFCSQRCADWFAEHNAEHGREERGSVETVRASQQGSGGEE